MPFQQIIALLIERALFWARWPHNTTQSRWTHHQTMMLEQCAMCMLDKLDYINMISPATHTSEAAGTSARVRACVPVCIHFGPFSLTETARQSIGHRRRPFKIIPPTDTRHNMVQRRQRDCTLHAAHRYSKTSAWVRSGVKQRVCSQITRCYTCKVVRVYVRIKEIFREDTLSLIERKKFFSSWSEHE